MRIDASTFRPLVTVAEGAVSPDLAVATAGGAVDAVAPPRPAAVAIDARMPPASADPAGEALVAFAELVNALPAALPPLVGSAFAPDVEGAPLPDGMFDRQTIAVALCCDHLIADAVLPEDAQQRLEPITAYVTAVLAFYESRDEQRDVAAATNASALPQATQLALAELTPRLAEILRGYTVAAAGAAVASTGLRLDGRPRERAPNQPPPPARAATPADGQPRERAPNQPPPPARAATPADAQLAVEQEAPASGDVVVPSPSVVEEERALTRAVERAAAPLLATFDVWPAGADIDALVSLVMMQATRLEEAITRDQLRDMAATTARKKALRSEQTRMKEARARLDSQMQAEFDVLRESGAIAAGWTLDDYKRWRECQWADPDPANAGTVAELTQPSPPQAIPLWLQQGPESAPAEAAAVGASDNVDGGSDPGAASACERYGLSADVERVLRRIYDGLPADERALYTSFDDFLAGQGFLAADGIGDVRENLLRVQELIVAATDQARSAATTGAVDSVALTEVTGENGRVRQAMRELVQWQLLAAAGVDVGSNVTRCQDTLAELCANAPATAAFADAYAAMVDEVVAEARAGVAYMFDQMNGWQDEGPGAVGVNIEDDFTDAEDVVRGEDENHERWVAHESDANEGTSHATGAWWDGRGGHGTFHYRETDDANSSGDREYGFLGDPKPGWVSALEDRLGSRRQQIDVSSFTAVLDFLDGAAAANAFQPADIPAEDAIATGLTADACHELKRVIDSALSDLRNPASRYRSWLEERCFAQAEPAEHAAGTRMRGDTVDAPLAHRGTLASFDAAISAVSDELDSLSEAGEIEMIRLQSALDRRQKMIDALSNVLKKNSQTQENIVSNLK